MSNVYVHTTIPIENGTTAKREGAPCTQARSAYTSDEQRCCSSIFDGYVVPPEFQNHIGRVTDALTPLLTEHRLEKMRHVVQSRSRQVCTVFENTHHAHNVSAVLRSQDSFGFLDVFFLYTEPIIKFRANDAIDRSASKWLMIRNFKTISECVASLKQKNYKIALVSRPDFSKTSQHYRADLKSFTTGHLDSPDFLDIISNNKIALIFGTELYGLSSEWIANADFYISVDMYGFSESLNVSVCAGVILNALRDVIMKQNPPLLISEFEQNLLLEHWVAKNTPNSYEFIFNQHKNLMDWYLFVRSGKFWS